MSSFRKVSLILCTEQGNANPDVSSIVENLTERRWETEIILVGSAANPLAECATAGQQRVDNPSAGLPSLTARNLSEAISIATHPTIAIADGDYACSPSRWETVAEQADQSPVQTMFAAPATSRRFLRFLVWTYAMLHRLMFGIKRTNVHRGLTVLNRAALSQELPGWIDANCDCDPHTSSGSQVTQLLALLRLHGVRILETESDDPRLSVDAAGLDLRTLHRASAGALRFWWSRVMFPREENQLQHQPAQPVQRIGWALGLFAAAVFLLFSCLNYPLIEPDEARNAQLALNVIESGQWMSLTLEDRFYWDKPPFQIWAIAASYKLFGVSQFSTRFPIALATLLTIMSTLLLGKRLVGFRAAWLGAGLLLLTSGFVIAGRYVTMDASLTAMATLCLLLGYIATRDRFQKPLAIAAGVALGFGLLIKGPVILVLCVPPLLVADWLSPTREPNTAQTKFRWIWFAVPAFVIAGPWFIATAIIHPDFIAYFFWKHHVVRFSNAFNHEQPVWFYWIGIFLFMFPASYLLPSVAKFMISYRSENRLWRTREQGFLLLSAFWTIFFFSLSQSKLPTYILPSFPPICLLMGVLLERKVLNRCLPTGNAQFAISTIQPNPSTPARQRKSKRTFLDGLTWRAPIELVLSITAISIGIFFLDRSSVVVFAGIGLAAAMAIVLSVFIFRYRSAYRLGWVSFGLLSLVVVSLGAHQLVPAISRMRSVHLATQNLGETEEFKDAPVVFFGRETYGAGLQLDLGRVKHFHPFQYYSMVRFLEQNPTSIIVSSENPMEALREDLPWTITLEQCETGRRHLFFSRPNVKAIAREQEKSYR